MPTGGPHCHRGVHVPRYAATLAHATHSAGLVLVADVVLAMQVHLLIWRRLPDGPDVGIFVSLWYGHYEGLHCTPS